MKYSFPKLGLALRDFLEPEAPPRDDLATYGPADYRPARRGLRPPQPVWQRAVVRYPGDAASARVVWVRCCRPQLVWSSAELTDRWVATSREPRPIYVTHVFVEGYVVEALAAHTELLPIFREREADVPPLLVSRHQRFEEWGLPAWPCDPALLS